MATISSSVKALNAFLKHSKQIFLKHHANSSTTSRHLHVVMGNEALDLDSTVSSILLANLYHHRQMSFNSEHSTIVDYIPLLPIDRRDFGLRTEAQFLFNKIGVDLTQALFIDDIGPVKLKEALLSTQERKSLRITLTDHNNLSQDFLQFAPSVVGIVDHHEDQSTHKTLEQEKEIVLPLGSCTTLVGERYLGITKLPSTQNLQDQSKEEESFDPSSLLSPCIVNLMIGTILIDTVNLQESFGRVTPRDVAVMTKLVEFENSMGDVYGLATVEERTELFTILQTIKFDLSRLTSSELLRKDYKAWKVGKVKYGISSVTLSTSEWLEKDAYIWETFGTFIDEQDLSFLVVMTSFTDKEDGAFKRELMIQPASPTPQRIIDTLELVNHIVSSTKSTLTLTPSSLLASPSYSNAKLTHYNQANIKLSRKQVQPAMHEALHEYVNRHPL